MSLCGQRQRGQSRRNGRLGSLESFHRLYFFSVNSADARCHCKKRVPSAEPALSVRHAAPLPARALKAANLSELQRRSKTNVHRPDQSPAAERKSGVEGKSGPVRVNQGGRRHITKTTKH